MWCGLNIFEGISCREKIVVVFWSGWEKLKGKPPSPFLRWWPLPNWCFVAWSHIHQCVLHVRETEGDVALNYRKLILRELVAGLSHRRLGENSAYLYIRPRISRADRCLFRVSSLPECFGQVILKNFFGERIMYRKHICWERIVLDNVILFCYEIN